VVGRGYIGVAGSSGGPNGWPRGGRDADPFISSVQAHRRGQRLQRHALRRRFLTACKSLGRERLRMLTIHHGRHTFISHALAMGRTLADVRDAAGHSSVLVPSAYLHMAVEDDGAIGSGEQAAFCAGYWSLWVWPLLVFDTCSTRPKR